MSIRKNNHPGIEIRENDRSRRAPQIVGTVSLVTGFSDKGESYNPINISSISDLETNFGIPTNEAERYFYYACREIVRQNGSLTAIKLPYNNIMDNNYQYVSLRFEDTLSNCNGISGWMVDPNYASLSSTLVPAAGIDGINHTLSGNISDVSLLTTAQYDIIVENNSIDGSAVAATEHFIFVNEQKAPLGGKRETEGIFLSFFDYVDGMIVQRLFDPSDTLPLNQLLGIKVPSGSFSYDVNSTYYDSWNNVTISGVINPTFENYVSNVSGEIRDNSFSEVLAGRFPNITFLEDGTKIDRELGQWLGVAVCKAIPDVNNDTKISLQIIEAFIGSIRPGDRNPATGQTTYLPNLVNAQSLYIKMYGSETNIENIPDNDDAVLHVPKNFAPLINFTKAESRKFIDGSQMITYLDIAYSKVDDIRDQQIDLVIDAGLTTIAQYTNDNPGVGTEFDSENDFDFDDSAVLSSTAQISTWRSVANAMLSFCSQTRKDCMAIIDAPRQIELIGRHPRLRKTNPTATFSNTIAPQLRYITGLSSSYGAMYDNWHLTFDTYTGRNVWMPPTIAIGGVYLNTDNVANYWDAPFGFNRGQLANIADLAYNPNGKSQDLLYTKSINYTIKDPRQGFITWGQKTLQNYESAFDRVNVRRLFLRLERQTYFAMQQFIGEPNNFQTRRQVLTTLEPLFSTAKTGGGIFDYKLICDSSNNPPETIDANELRVAILIKPTRTIEFILVDFYAVSTGVSFSEVQL